MDHNIIHLEAIDPPSFDIRPIALVTPDFNGNPVVHLFVLGERVAQMYPNWDWDYELTYPHSTAERQACITLAYCLGGITEEQNERFCRAAGTDSEAPTFDDVMGEPTDEGHAVIAYMGLVAQRVYQLHPEACEAPPTGW